MLYEYVGGKNNIGLFIRHANKASGGNIRIKVVANQNRRCVWSIIFIFNLMIKLYNGSGADREHLSGCGGSV